MSASILPATRSASSSHRPPDASRLEEQTEPLVLPPVHRRPQLDSVGLEVRHAEFGHDGDLGLDVVRHPHELDAEGVGPTAVGLPSRIT